MNDDGIPAACEADVGAIATHVIVQYLFDRPGFQQDPVADTAADALLGTFALLLTHPGRVEEMSRNTLRYRPPTEDEHFANIFRATGVSAVA